MAIRTNRHNARVEHLNPLKAAEQVRAEAKCSSTATKRMRPAILYLSTPEEASAVTSMIAAECPNPATAAIGIMELLMNAIEHGNLGITYSEKKALKQEDRWEAEVECRLGLPENRNKTVRLDVNRHPNGIELRITDQGVGFDWRRYLEIDHRRAFDPNGRGIAVARLLSFTSMHYEGHGNVVVALISSEASNAS